MGIFGGSGGGNYPPTSPIQASQPVAAPLPPAPPPAPTPTDPAVTEARDAAKRRAAAMAGYANTITTSGLGILTPASTTAGKVALGA